MPKIWSQTGGWSEEEEELLYLHFGDDTTLDLMERSPIDPRVVIVWVEWDRQHPSIYVVHFGERNQYGGPGTFEFMGVPAIKQSERWRDYFPDRSAAH